MCRRSIALHANGVFRRHGDGAVQGTCSGSGKFPKPRRVRDAILPPEANATAALRAALARMLMNSVVDDAECTCCEDHEGGEDTCPECEAMRALGLGDWPGARKAERLLGKVRR